MTSKRNTTLYKQARKCLDDSQGVGGASRLLNQPEAVRSKLKKLGIRKKDVREAILWARKF